MLIAYKLVKPYPLQKVGDLVKGYFGIWKFQGTGQEVNTKQLESDFFEKIYFEGKPGDVYLYKSGKTIHKVTLIKIEGNKASFKYTNGKNQTHTTDIKNLDKIITYWFFNSFLEPHSDEISSDSKLEDYKKRLELNNCFETKVECKEALEKIKNVLNPTI
jgi:hypothetical protein